MAFHHHQNHHCTTPPPCCCHHQNPPPFTFSPAPFPPASDPFLTATLISQLLHSQNPQKPTSISQNQTYPFNQTHHFNPNSSPFLSSLLNRIDSLESSLSLYRLSSSSSSYLRDAAARVIQIHFRVFLVRRSRTLGQLKQLANVKSNLGFLKSQSSVNGFVDYHYLSNNAMDLLLVVVSIQDEDKMIRDRKKSITREIFQFLEMIGVCVKRHQVMTRNIRSMRLVRGDKARTGRDSKGYSEGEGAVGSKSRNVDNQEKKLIANLRERVERIGKMSRELETEGVDDESEGYGDLGDGNGGSFNRIKSKYSRNNGVPINKSVTRVGGSKGLNMDSEGKGIIAKLRERVERIGKMSRTFDAEEVDDETEGIEHVCDEDGDTFNQITSKYGPINGVTINKSVARSDGKKHVCFVEDRNVIGVYNADGDEIIDGRDVEELDDSTNGRQDGEEEARNDGEQSTQSSEDASCSKSYEVEGNHNHDEEFSFPAPEAMKMGPSVEFLTRKPDVKISG